MLLESALQLIFLNSDIVNPYAKYLDDALDQFEDELDFCSNASQIKSVIKLNIEAYFPITLMVDVYEKYLLLNRRDAEILRRYAEFIDFTIEDWRDYADKLIKEAENIEMDKI